MFEPKSYKILLVGSPGSGKTVYIERFLTGKFVSQYVPTLDVQINGLKFNTSDGPIDLEIWELPSENPDPKDFSNADGAIIFYDSLDQKSLDQVEDWIDKIRKFSGPTGSARSYDREIPETGPVCPEPIGSVRSYDRNIPITICGNKVDLPGKHLHRKGKISQWHVSGKSLYNYFKPFLYLMRKIKSNPNLEFLSSP